VTRHQVWKARERARFRMIAESVRMKNKSASFEDFKRSVWAKALYEDAQKLAAQHGIPEPFLG